MMSDMMKKMSKGNTKGLMADKGIPPELFNQLKIKKGEINAKVKIINGRNKKKTSL